MHIVLLGDSIFDNVYYITEEEKSVIDHLRSKLPTYVKSTLLAEDGAVTSELYEQIAQIPEDASHIVISCGGNDALMMLSLLSEKSNTVRDSLEQLIPKMNNFRKDYQQMLEAVMEKKIPITVCTIYNNVPRLPEEEKLALSLFNDVITEEALKAKIQILDLRQICTVTDDYSEISPIEPSAKGGEKIVKNIVRILE